MKQIVLMYHDVFVSDVKESGFQTPGAMPYKVSVNNFETHVKTIYKYCKENDVDTSSIVFTFDDGGVSFATIIPKVLEMYGFKGIFFVSTHYIGKERFLTENQIRDLVSRGHEIGAHSHTHPGYNEAAKMNSAQLRYEWQTSINLLSTIIDNKIESVSLPNGYNSDHLLEILEDMGINRIYTSTPTTRITKRRHSTLIGRYDIQNCMSLKQVMSIVNNPMARIKFQLKCDVLSLLKFILGDSYSNVKRVLLSKC